MKSAGYYGEIFAVREAGPVVPAGAGIWVELKTNVIVGILLIFFLSFFFINFCFFLDRITWTSLTPYTSNSCQGGHFFFESLLPPSSVCCIWTDMLRDINS